MPEEFGGKGKERIWVWVISDSPRGTWWSVKSSGLCRGLIRRALDQGPKRTGPNDLHEIMVVERERGACVSCCERSCCWYA